MRDGLDASIAASPSARLGAALPLALPDRLLRVLALGGGIDPDRRAGETPRAVRHAWVHAIKDVVWPVAGTRGFDFAEVTAGGVALDEVEGGTMESRRVPGLFLAGEILDVDGPIGGFNFQAAFSTGETAGRSV